MRRFARLAIFGLLLSFGCTGGPSSNGSGTVLKVPEKLLGVAFDDIPAKAAATIPLSLTSSDGSGLTLVALQGRAVIDDPLAFTELHLTFENPEDRVLEGTFSIVLPQGAAISRFAMKNEAGFQEGEVVEKQQARVAYEDSLHRKQDPALLEQAGGNEFSARVFPIPARGRKELIVSYSQELSKRAPYVLPLKGMPEIGNVDLEAYVVGRAAPVVTLAKQALKPQADFVVEASVLGERAGVRNGNLVLARVTPIVGSQPEPLAASLILVDTSASRALGMVEQARIVQRLCAAIARASGPKTPVVVAAYDQTIEPVFDGVAADFGEPAIDRMRQRLALGASNLEAALGWAGQTARAKNLARVVLVTDGVPTAGETGGEKLRERTVGLASLGVQRLDAVALGGIRDDDMLKSLVNAGLPKGGVVVDGAMSEEEMWRRLNEATRSGIEVKVENSVFSFPEKIDGVQSGDEVLVYANVPEDKPVRISVGGAPATSPDLTRVERPMLERAWVGAKIKGLLERERISGESAALSKEIVGLSTQFRVLSPKTSLLVLEADWDYARFGIDRRALADILVADGSRVSLLKRKLPDLPKPVPPVVVVQSTPVPGPQWRATKPSVRSGSASGGSAAPSKPAAKLKPADSGGFGGGQSAPAASAAPIARPSPGPQRPLADEAVRDDKKGSAGPAAAAPGGLGRSGGGEGSASFSPPAPVVLPSAAAPATAPRGTASSAGDQGYGYEFSDQPMAPPAEAAAVRDPRAENRPPPPSRRETESSADSVFGGSGGAEIPRTDPYTGMFKTVMDLAHRGQAAQALKTAFEWRKSEPGDVMALVALGEAFEAAGDALQAARCYGSIIDLFPGRADLRRFAGERLEHLPLGAALDLAADTYGKAEVERPDHPASHRLFAFALLKKGQHEKAFEAIVRGMRRSYPNGRFAGVTRILREDLGLVGAAWARAEPKREEEILSRVRNEGGEIESEPSLRFVLNWETDANDVDFHIYDGNGGHAFYSEPTLSSGGTLYADVTTGYGPECFTIRARADRRSGPYRLLAQYYSRGPMGYGMGKLQIIDHDGRGGLIFEERPFVVMVDHAFVDLGVVKK
jgi:hypothetical protein